MKSLITRSQSISAVMGLLALVIGASIVFVFVDVELLIQTVGVDNSYLILFLVALIGGASVVTTSSYLALLYLMVNSGLSPLILGSLAGLAIFIGDLVFYLLGKKAGEALNAVENPTAAKFQDWISKRSIRSVQLFTYVYAGLTPLPNDILTIGLGASKVTLKQIFWPLLIGSIQLQIITAYLFSLGFLGGLIN